MTPVQDAGITCKYSPPKSSKKCYTGPMNSNEELLDMAGQLLYSQMFHNCPNLSNRKFIHLPKLAWFSPAHVVSLFSVRSRTHVLKRFPQHRKISHEKWNAFRPFGSWRFLEVEDCSSPSSTQTPSMFHPWRIFLKGFGFQSMSQSSIVLNAC